MPPISFDLKKRFLRLVIFLAAANLIAFPLAILYLPEDMSGDMTTVQAIMMYLLPPLSTLIHNVMRFKGFYSRVPRIVDLLYSMIELASLLVAIILPFTRGFYRRIWTPPVSEALYFLLTITLTGFYTLAVFGSFVDVCCARGKNLLMQYRLDPNEKPGFPLNEESIPVFGALPWKKRYHLIARPAFNLSTFRQSRFDTFWIPNIDSVWYNRPHDMLLVFLFSHQECVLSTDGVTVCYEVVLPGGTTFGTVCGSEQPRSQDQYIDLNVLPPIVISCNATSDQSLQFPTPNEQIRIHEYVYIVDFSKIPASSKPPYVSFYLRDSDTSVGDTIVSTEPTILWPGSKLAGIFSLKRFNTLSGVGASLGLPKYTESTLWEIRSLIPDPTPPSLNDTINMASLRLIAPVLPQFPFLIQESTSNTVLDGISFIGGVWTSTNGVFAAIFGCSLLFVTFGSRPLSMYGLVHHLGNRKPLLIVEGLNKKELKEEDKEHLLRSLSYLLDQDDRNETPTEIEGLQRRLTGTETAAAPNFDKSIDTV
ncbi:hypothetical protein NP233_g7305 [Leucocoprinus birnbaumii]|uniref:Uncharacterized protein n=1 Tax=Leucocoprinus birnbaumii TaxID=56174 RepID=A0AAD5VUX9_9AGAR|nr:hypothetical protein NP233_g7305 [Leucocoprinus birnbaumii]